MLYAFRQYYLPTDAKSGPYIAFTSVEEAIMWGDGLWCYVAPDEAASRSLSRNDQHFIVPTAQTNVCAPFAVDDVADKQLAAALLALLKTRGRIRAPDAANLRDFLAGKEVRCKVVARELLNVPAFSTWEYLLRTICAAKGTADYWKAIEFVQAFLPILNAPSKDLVGPMAKELKSYVQHKIS